MFKKVKNNPVHTLIMEQISDVEDCLIQFESFIRAFCTPESRIETLRSLADGISKAEAVADISLRRMIDSLVGTSFLPSTRQDIISIASSCDSIANKCETFSHFAVIQNLKFPEEYSEQLLEIISITRAQFDLLEDSISQLFAQFSDLLKDHSILDDIRRHESKVDTVATDLYEKIFSLDIDLASRMQMANFLDLICEPSDIIENIADKIQIMLVTRKA